MEKEKEKHKQEFVFLVAITIITGALALALALTRFILMVSNVRSRRSVLVAHLLAAMFLGCSRVTAYFTAGMVTFLYLLEVEDDRSVRDCTFESISSSTCCSVEVGLRRLLLEWYGRSELSSFSSPRMFSTDFDFLLSLLVGRARCN